MAPRSIIGIIKRHPDGFGFLVPEDPAHPDVYIPRHAMAGVMTNDKVEARVFPTRRGDRMFGEIDKVVTRNTKQVSGRLTWVSDREAMLLDESKTWGANLKVFKEFSMGAAEGEYVAAEIISYPTVRGDFVGRVVKKIGSAENPLNDVKRVIAVSQLPEGFSKEAVREAEAYGPVVDPNEAKNRKDLRDLPFITIDGATAKDFDDAIYVQQTQLGFKAHIAIADVAHYVKEGTNLDKEALEKGNSTYFPNYVVPMLPEHLSNGLCSLNPNVDRLAMVAEVHVDFHGEPLHTYFYDAVINSRARVTYGEAQEVVDGKTPERLEIVEKEIRIAADLSKILMAKRFENGSLDLEIPSTEVLIDSQGIPVDIVRSERLFAHRLIEELMLLANVAVAKFLSSREIPAIYRIHEPPDQDNIEGLQRYLDLFGSKRKVSGTANLQKKLTKALQEFSGKPEAQVLNILTLRSMSQAKYSAESLGHFGLGFEFYTHFTSPIRRYADLIVHRLLKNQLKKPPGRTKSYEDLQQIATLISACEQRSVKAERLLVAIKKARFMSPHVGEEFDGVISSVAKFGIFVLLRQYDVDGLIKADELGNDRFVFDEENLMLVGKRSGRKFSIGDAVKVQVIAVNTEEGQIDFTLVKEPGQEGRFNEDEAEDSLGDSKPKRSFKKDVSPVKQKSFKKSKKGQGESDGVSRNSNSNRKNNKKRGKAKDDSRDLRKVRVPGRRQQD